MPLMAYSPLDQGELSDHAVLREVAARHPGATPSQVALAWVLRHPGVMAIPKAGKEAHLRENWAAQQLQLGDEDLARLERSFAAPRGPVPLAMR
jgi:diketogulonate reductase-like aldo/keto reductase